LEHVLTENATLVRPATKREPGWSTSPRLKPVPQII
jgi:hypothetical protein